MVWVALGERGGSWLLLLGCCVERLRRIRALTFSPKRDFRGIGVVSARLDGSCLVNSGSWPPFHYAQPQERPRSPRVIDTRVKLSINVPSGFFPPALRSCNLWYYALYYASATSGVSVGVKRRFQGDSVGSNKGARTTTRIN